MINQSSVGARGHTLVSVHRGQAQVGNTMDIKCAAEACELGQSVSQLSVAMSCRATRDGQLRGGCRAWRAGQSPAWQGCTRACVCAEVPRALRVFLVCARCVTHVTIGGAVWVGPDQTRIRTKKMEGGGPPPPPGPNPPPPPLLRAPPLSPSSNAGGSLSRGPRKFLG